MDLLVWRGRGRRSALSQVCSRVPHFSAGVNVSKAFPLFLLLLISIDRLWVDALVCVALNCSFIWVQYELIPSKTTCIFCFPFLLSLFGRRLIPDQDSDVPCAFLNGLRLTFMNSWWSTSYPAAPHFFFCRSRFELRLRPFHILLRWAEERRTEAGLSRRGKWSFEIKIKFVCRVSLGTNDSSPEDLQSDRLYQRIQVSPEPLGELSSSEVVDQAGGHTPSLPGGRALRYVDGPIDGALYALVKPKGPSSADSGISVTVSPTASPIF